VKSEWFARECVKAAGLSAIQKRRIMAGRQWYSMMRVWYLRVKKRAKHSKIVF